MNNRNVSSLYNSSGKNDVNTSFIGNSVGRNPMDFHSVNIKVYNLVQVLTLGIKNQFEACRSIEILGLGINGE